MNSSHDRSTHVQQKTPLEGVHQPLHQTLSLLSDVIPLNTVAQVANHFVRGGEILSLVLCSSIKVTNLICEFSLGWNDKRKKQNETTGAAHWVT